MSETREELQKQFDDALRRARAAAERETAVEQELRLLREDLAAAERAAEEARRAFDTAAAELREAQAAHETARLRAEELREHAATLEGLTRAAAAQAERVKSRLKGRVNQDLDLAERTVRRSHERLAEARPRLQAAERLEGEAATRLAERQAAAEKRKAEFVAAAERVDALETRLNDAQENACDVRTAGRAAMAQAWLRRTILEAWVAGRGVTDKESAHV